LTPLWPRHPQTGSRNYAASIHFSADKRLPESGIGILPMMSGHHGQDARATLPQLIYEIFKK
jgi:hypothetical protein